MLRFLATAVATLLLLAIMGAAAVLGAFWYFGQGLPDYRQLADYEPPVMTRVHAGDGSLITEYATERRVFVPIEATPKLVVKAFLAAEDKNFYSHPGVDFLSVVRAAVTNLMNYGTSRRPVGASTITQQVAKNFLLTNEVSFERKIKEAILAFRIEHAFTKDRILELYLNEIYLGLGSYGVAAAALNYFDKSLDELTVAEVAYLAALPKAPSNYHPVRNRGHALGRRGWVIERMLDEGFIGPEEARSARLEPLAVRERAPTLLTRAEYFAEEVRRELNQRYGQDKLYRGGLSVRTTLDPALQSLADATLQRGLVAYDRRHGWRGPVARLEKIEQGEDWMQRLAAVTAPPAYPDWRLAVVLEAEGTVARVGFADGETGTIPLEEMTWARAVQPDGRLGPQVRAASQVVSPGDVVLTEPRGRDGVHALRQIPDANGAIVALDPHTGRVLAMSGGYSFAESQFNRATQAARQPGSAFKPFVYLAALDSGFTPSSRILDAPFVIDQGPGLGLWKPQNYSETYYGPSTMRRGLEQSRNLMTVRLAQTIGMDKVTDYARNLGVVDDIPPRLAMALGAGETTLLRLTTAYAMLVNGGRQVTPSLIDRIQDRHGRTVFRHDGRACPGCGEAAPADARDGPPAMPAIPDTRAQVADARSAYQIVSMLQGAVQRGTARRLADLGRPLAGKTGTTNDSNDAWFVGFTPDLVVGIYVGHDRPRSLGRGETGSSVAVPIFRDFMEKALEDRPSIPFRVPAGIRLVRVNAETGAPARPGERNVILEAFKAETDLARDQGVLDGSGPLTMDGGGATRGLY